MQLPIGVSNFRQLIVDTDLAGNHYIFVDKSLFIRDIFNNMAAVILITRPRRFGKTLNMSMLNHFFASSVDNQPTQGLFDNLKITTDLACMQHQGKYPVIFLTFKDIKGSSFTNAYASICSAIRNLYEQHVQLLTHSKLMPHQKQVYESILAGNATEINVRTALRDLTSYLHQCYGVKPIVLIDEYDTPIQSAYVAGYYVEMIDFMREFLSTALKDNPYLQKAVLTGILRVSKESLFSGLNNIQIYSLLDSMYGEYFGFTEPEVIELSGKATFNSTLNVIKEWYNGYQVGNAVIYNPWSIISYLSKNDLNTYWVNTSDNALIKKLLLHANLGIKIQFEALLQDKPIEHLITDNFVFTYLDNLDTNESVLWTLLLMAGYLKVIASQKGEFGQLCQLAIPNKEVKILYKVIIAEWLAVGGNPANFNNFLNNLLSGKMEYFADHLQTLMLQTFSVYDVKGKEPEKFYHGFVLGLIAGLDPSKYIINSNKESGLGRYDIALIPTDVNNLGVILELKVSS